MTEQPLSDQQKETIRRIRQRQTRTGAITERKGTPPSTPTFSKPQTTSKYPSNRKRLFYYIKKYLFILFIIIIILVSVLILILRYSFPSTNLKKGNIFGGSKDDWASSVIQTDDGGYALAGVTASYGSGLEDAWVVKLDNKGNKLWDKTFGGSDLDWASSIIQTTDGGYAIAGRNKSYGSGLEDAWLVKLDSQGNKIWDKTFGGSKWDVAYSLVQTTDGGYALAGATESEYTGKLDAWFIKLDNQGKLLLDRTYGGSSDDLVTSIIQTSDGGYTLAGSTKSYGTGEQNAYVLNLDSDGTIRWVKAFGGSKNDAANSIIQTNDGGYAVAGYTSSYGEGGTDFWLIKLDSQGNKQWDKHYGGSKNDAANSIIQTKDGIFYIVGYTESFGNGYKDAWLIKLDSRGNKLSSCTFGKDEDDDAHSLIQTLDGNYTIAGYTRSKYYGASSADFWFIKIELLSLSSLVKVVFGILF